MNKDEKIQRLTDMLRPFTKHRYCEDPWYACPKQEEYIGTDSLDVCDCWADEVNALLAEIAP